jgi:hypothetical protein
MKKLQRMTLMPHKSLLKMRKTKFKKIRQILKTRTNKSKTQNLNRRIKRMTIKTRVKVSLKMS